MRISLGFSLAFDHREHAVERVVVELLATLKECDQFLEQLSDGVDGGRILATDAHLVAADADPRGRELLLDPAQHMVTGSEQSGHQMIAGDDDGGVVAGDVVGGVRVGLVIG